MKVLAVDFDNTITDGSTTQDPKVDLLLRNKLITIHDSATPPFIVVYTARPHSNYFVVRAWLEKHCIPFDAIECGKMRADCYIDDKALVPEMFISHGGEI